MSIMLADRVKETTTTTGTGTLDLAGAATGFQGFVAGVGDAAEVYYVIVGQAGGGAEGEWEVGIGTVTDAATDTLSRTTVLASSNAGAAVNFSAGTKDVFLTAPSEVLRYPIVRQATRTSGNITVGSTSWVDLDTNLDLDVPARAGDIVVVTMNSLVTPAGNGSGGFDAWSVVGGSPVNQWGGGNYGAGVWRHIGTDGNRHLTGSVARTLVSGDIASGQVKVRLRWRATVSNSHTIQASTDYPFFWQAINYSPDRVAG